MKLNPGWKKVRLGVYCNLIRLPNDDSSEVLFCLQWTDSFQRSKAKQAAQIWTEALQSRRKIFGWPEKGCNCNCRYVQTYKHTRETRWQSYKINFVWEKTIHRIWLCVNSVNDRLRYKGAFKNLGLISFFIKTKIYFIGLAPELSSSCFFAQIVVKDRKSGRRWANHYLFETIWWC